MLLQLAPNTTEKLASLGYDLQNKENGQEKLIAILVVMLSGGDTTSVQAYSDTSSPTGFNAIKTAYGL